MLENRQRIKPMELSDTLSDYKTNKKMRPTSLRLTAKKL